MNNKICIITATYNSEKTIKDTLISINNQTYKNFHHLVIDGCSSDNTIKIVNSFKNENLSIIIEEDNGIYDAMNKGLANIKGEIVGFLNSDDTYANNEVLQYVADIFNDEKVKACYGDLVYTDYSNTKIIRYWESGKFSKDNFAKGWFPPHPTFYIRKELIDQYGTFDLGYKLAADAEYMLRILTKDLKIAYIQKVLIKMRQGGATNKSLSNIFKQNKEIFRALKRHNIHFSMSNFIFHKIKNRFTQIVRSSNYS